MTDFNKGSIDEQREHLKSACETILDWSADGAHRPPDSAEAQAFRWARDGLKAALTEIDNHLEDDHRKADLLRMLLHSVVASWALGMAGAPLDSTHRQAILSQLRERQSAAGKASGRKRKESRRWVGRATELAIRAREENPSFGRSKIADFILEYWDPDQHLPGHETLVDFVKELEEGKVIPKSIKGARVRRCIEPVQ